MSRNLYSGNIFNFDVKNWIYLVRGMMWAWYVVLWISSYYESIYMWWEIYIQSMNTIRCTLVWEWTNTALLRERDTICETPALCCVCDQWPDLTLIMMNRNLYWQLGWGICMFAVLWPDMIACCYISVRFFTQNKIIGCLCSGFLWMRSGMMKTVRMFSIC